MYHQNSAQFIQVDYLGDDYKELYPDTDRYGHCAPIALTVATRAAGINVSYDCIADDVIGLKRANRDFYPTREEEWFDQPGSVPNEIILSLLERYFQEQFSRTIVLETHPIGTLSAALADVPFALVLSLAHITTIKDGVVYDSWDSRRKAVSEIYCLPKFRATVRKAVKDLAPKGLKQRRPISAKSELTPEEMKLASKELRMITNNRFYWVMMESMNRAFSIRRLLRQPNLECLINQEFEEDSDFVWSENIDRLFIQRLKNLERRGIIRIIPPSFANDTASLLETELGSKILSHLANIVE